MTIGKSIDAAMKDESPPHPVDLAVVGMAHSLLGADDRAREYQRRLVEAMEKPTFKNDSVAFGFLCELTRFC